MERDAEALQNYVMRYSSLHEKYGDISAAEVPLLKRLLEEDHLGYQLWGVNRDYENIVHQCLKEGWYKGLLVLISVATTTSPYIGNCPQLNQRDRFGDAPLHLAARSIDLLAISHLLRLPAVDVRATDRGGKNILHLLFLRIQIRWNRFRRREGEQTTHTASNERRLEPKEAEVVETVEAVLARADSASDFLLQVDKMGLNVFDYALGLRSHRLLLALLHRMAHNTSTQYLNTAHRMEVLIGLLKSAILLNQYDLVYTLARLVLKINKKSDVKAGRYSHKRRRTIESERASRSSEGREFVDLVLLCLQQGLATSLQALISVTSEGEGGLTFASSLNKQGTAKGMWFSADKEVAEETRAVCIVNCTHPHQYPLQLAVRRATMQDTTGKSTKVRGTGMKLKQGMRPGNAAAAMVFAISMVRTLIRAGAKVLVLLPQQGDTKNHADNLFALTAQGGNVDLLRVLLLAAEQESSSSSVRTSSSVPPRQLKLMAAESRGHGFFLEHLQAASNPSCMPCCTVKWIWFATYSITRHSKRL